MSVEPFLSEVQGDAPANDVARDSRELRLFVRNVALLIVAGVAISWWLLEFTDVFPAVGGFFGLAGIFAWIAFLGNLVKDDRKKQLQDVLETRFLLSTTTTAVTMVVFVLFGCWVALHGALILIAPGDGTKRVLEIRDDAATLETIELAPGETVKVPFWIRQRRRSLVVKTAGLPELGVTIPRAGRAKIVIPQSFQDQPVVFALGFSREEDLASLGPSPSLRAQIRRGHGVWQEYGRLAPGAYAAESVWIGASPDTELPPSLRERQKTQAQPKALGAEQPLRVGDEIRLCVMNSESGEVAFGELTVLDRKQRSFPQELRLEMIPDEKKRCMP